MRPKLVPNCNRAISLLGAEKGFRLNGRTPKEFRPFQMTFGKSYGSAEVIFQPITRVLTQVSCSIGEPNDSRPGEGIMTVSVWISPTATGEMGGGGSQRPALIARTLEKLFKEHKVVDLESLCIKFGEKVWVLRVDVHILDTNGCLTEAAALSVLGALLTFKRPQAYIDVNTDELVVLSIEDSTPVRLHLHHLPVLTSFSLSQGNRLLAEPDHQEEEVLPGKLVVGINDSKELCFLHLTNIIEHDVLTEATRLAEEKCLERINWVKELVAADDEVRKVPVYVQRLTAPRSTGAVIDIPPIQIPVPDKTSNPNSPKKKFGKNVQSQSSQKCDLNETLNRIKTIRLEEISILKEDVSG